VALLILSFTSLEVSGQRLLHPRSGRWKKSWPRTAPKGERSCLVERREVLYKAAGQTIADVAGCADSCGASAELAAEQLLSWISPS
jgi:hypothetical protein